GMRESLYFKDDDSRLSFLYGNYVTLTNMSDRDIDRIIEYRMSPVYISFQTTDPMLRCRMLGNRFAGEALKKAQRLYEAGIEMNGQIVLCKGINDNEALERTLKDLSEYAPVLRSVSVVPVGLTRYREGLFELTPFDKKDAVEVIRLVEKWQRLIYSRYGYHFVHASDEFYLLAEMPLPEAGRYDGYLQYENGVGMLRAFMDDFEEALLRLKEILPDNKALYGINRRVSCATGMLAYSAVLDMTRRLEELIPGLKVFVYPIRNEFFGEMITVTGLLTGRDIMEQLKDRELGECLLLSEAMAREEEPILLDDVSIGEMERTLQVNIDIVKSNGMDFIEKVLGEVIYE
ncbi:MAG TPA: radical SAM protein, partial [Lachnospiraceae bacterium]|nr:radical SAM protein [Lachnospiraceae bacterium]